ncbi:TPA: hypothetical protein N2A55_004542 [Pseudomonas aeruginosa]|nr:hypothetical protein [Pseudomonas aeruginosa]
MTLLFSQALVKAYLEATYSNSATPTQLNAKPTQQRFWRNDESVEHSRLSQLGLPYAALTDAHGEALLIWYREDFLAKTFPQRDL